MSTSAMVAKLDLLKEIPSCSRSENEVSAKLDIYTWGKIFENVAAEIDLKKALQLQSLHSEAYRAVERVLRKNTKLEIHVNEKEWTIQGSKTKCFETAIRMISHVRSRSDKITSLELFLGRENDDQLNRIVDEIVHYDNVELKRLSIRRMYIGTVNAVIRILEKNGRTLKEVSKVTVHEAVEGLRKNCELEKLGLMTFELDHGGDNRILLMNLSRLHHGMRMKKLSISGYWGLDVTEDVVTNMLRQAQVETLRLTMMEPPFPNNVMMNFVKKVRNVKKVEFVEVNNNSKRPNRMPLWLETAKEVFPAATIELLRQVD